MINPCFVFSLPLIIYPSGKFIVVKNLNNPAECFIYRGHSQPTTVAKFSPNGFWVASGDTSGKIRVWSWDHPEHLTKLETLVFAGGVADLDWDNESKKIACVGDGTGILVKCITWDTGNNAGEMLGHNKRVLSVAYKPTRPFRIITGSEDFKSLFYQGPPFKLDHSNSTHTNFINCVRYAPNGSKAISVGSDKRIQLYDGATGEPTVDITNGHEGGVYSVAFSPDSQHFLTASADKTVKMWNVESLALEETFTFSADPQLGDAQVAVLWTANHMVSVSLNGNINVLDRANPSSPRVIHAHQVAITALHVDVARKVAYTGSFDGVVIARDLTTPGKAVRVAGTDKRNIPGGAHGGKVVAIATHGDEVLSVGWDDSLRTASAATNAYSADTGLTGQPSDLTQASGTDLVLAVTNQEIALYRGLTKVSSLSVPYGPTCGALLGETECAVGGCDNKTHIYSIGAGHALTETATIPTRSAISSLAYNPQGDCLAIGDVGRQVEVYERGTWTPRIKDKWVFHTSKVTALAWSPSGNVLASGSLDENIFLWNNSKPASKIQLAFAHMGGVTGLGWLSEESLISTGNDHTMVTWKIPAEWA